MNSTPPSVDQPSEYPDEPIDLAELIRKVREFAKVVWRDRRYIWRGLAVTIPVGLLFAFGRTPEFTASTRILPYLSGNGSSGLSGLAGLAGIRIPVGGSDQTITADLYPDVASALEFRIVVAETPIRFGTLSRPTSTVTYFREVSRTSLIGIVRRYTIDVPARLLSALRPVWKRVTISDTTDGRSPLPYYDPAYLKIVNGLKERLTVQVNRKNAIITIQGTMPDAYAAADLVKTASDRLMERIIEYESRKAAEHSRFVEQEQGRSRERFDRAQRELAAFTDRNRGTLSATAQIAAQRLQSEYNLTFDLYRQFSTELEQSKIKQNQDTPIFTTLEEVVVPNTRTSPRRQLDLLASIFFGVIGGVGFIAWRQLR